LLRIAKGEIHEKGDEDEEELRRFTLDKFASPNDKKKLSDNESLNKDEYTIAEQHEPEGLGSFF